MSKSITVHTYTGQQDIAIIHDEKAFKDVIYEKLEKLGTTIVTYDSYIKYKRENEGKE